MKQCVEPESTKPVADNDRYKGNSTGRVRESGLESAAALRRTSGSALLEFPQPSGGAEVRGLLTLLPAQTSCPCWMEWQLRVGHSRHGP